MTIWTDAHLPAGLAPWLSDSFPEVEAYSVQYLGLRDAEDEVIFSRARKAGAIVMTKDRDFLRLLAAHGPPPHVIWITCGNTSNAHLRRILTQTLPTALALLEEDPLVEIGG